MFMLFITMIFALYLHGQFVPELPQSDEKLLAMLLLPRLAVGLLYWLLCNVTYRRLMRGHGRWAMPWLHRLTRLHILILLILFLSDLYNGLLLRLEQIVGSNIILLDDILVILPTLLMILWSWSCYYPIDHRLREATMMRRLDAGEPVHPLATRSQYVLAQFRHQVAIILLPLLLLRGWSETIALLPPLHVAGLTINPLLALAGATGVMLFSPAILRRIWDTHPLPAGNLRASLESLCAHHRIGVRELLLWRPHGGMINAAVMGLIAPLRYILLTDALLENVPARQVEAVMAHEIGHVRRRHLIWLVATAVALLLGLEILWRVILNHLIWPRLATWPVAQGWNVSDSHVETLSMALALASWFFLFGWISRRFERQADTFAVQHLATRYGQSIHPQRGRTVDEESAHAMIDALQRIADLNHVAVNRNSWRHGSILWRQRYLQSIVGHPLDQLEIDALMKRIKLLTALVIAAVVVFEIIHLSQTISI